MKNVLKKKVLVAMSGGVDSSVAAALLVQQGYEVVGATMQVWDYSQCSITEGEGTCCSSTDVDDARSVADLLQIPFYVLNCEAQFKSAVIDPFVASYLKGNTPLPCVDCNTYLKFDHLIKKMNELGCDYLATGHYAQVSTNSLGNPCIRTSTDDWKDQTYFLFTIDPAIISRLKFPIGHLNKNEVRKIAEEKGLVTAKKKDSTGICFVGKMGYDKFIEQQVAPEILASKKGIIRRYRTNEVMGQHSGIHQFTYGQSKGLGMHHHEKLFVIKIDPETNVVWVGDEGDLYSSTARIVRPHLLGSIDAGEILNVKIRYSHSGAFAKVTPSNEGEYQLEFLEPQRAVTPGQAAVFYRGQELLGGGWIV